MDSWNILGRRPRAAEKKHSHSSSIRVSLGLGLAGVGFHRCSFAPWLRLWQFSRGAHRATAICFQRAHSAQLARRSIGSAIWTQMSSRSTIASAVTSRRQHRSSSASLPGTLWAVGCGLERRGPISGLGKRHRPITVQMRWTLQEDGRALHGLSVSPSGFSNGNTDDGSAQDASSPGEHGGQRRAFAR